MVVSPHPPTRRDGLGGPSCLNGTLKSKKESEINCENLIEKVFFFSCSIAWYRLVFVPHLRFLYTDNSM